MLEPFLNVLVHETNICGNVLTLNSGDALTSQDLKHLQHLDSGKFWWLWTSSGFVHVWPRFIVTSWLQQHVRSHHPWMWWRNELCSHTMYFSILIALNPSRCTTFCTASVSTSGTRGITTCPHPPWTSDGKMRLATHSLVAMNFDLSTFCMSVDLTGSKVRTLNFSFRLRSAHLGLTWSLSLCAWVATRPCPIATCFLKLKKSLALGFGPSCFIAPLGFFLPDKFFSTWLQLYHDQAWFLICRYHVSSIFHEHATSSFMEISRSWAIQ